MQEEQKGGLGKQRDQAADEKKEEFRGFMETCCLGTPFPRSALFL
jgi:hypothetical protein